MSETQRNNSEQQEYTYDRVPYHSDPFPQTHPDLMATIATLFGMTPPSLERCRVLEIGCASGGNLIPMAMELATSTFVGIDLSSRQIAEARETVAALGVENIEFRQGNFKDIAPELGPFDYTIAHGVYSWVAPEVAGTLLEVCAQNLAPNGIAYVSFNSLTGWHMRGMVRDMMCYHTRQFVRPAVRVRQARALLNFMVESVPGEKNPYGIYLRNELEQLRKMRDSYIYHEHLENENNPVYFYQFIERAESSGLQYLGEAHFGAMALAVHDFPAKVLTTLRKVAPNLIHREQYLDFLRNRTFRQTLLCHKEIELDRSLSTEHMTDLYVSSPAKPVAPEVNLRSQEAQEFRIPAGATLPIRQPITKAALLHLSEVWPKAVTFQTLCTAAQARVAEVAEQNASLLKDNSHLLGTSLRSLYAVNFAEFSVREPPTSPAVSDRPVASPLVRLLAQRGRLVTNRRHRIVAVTDFERRVLEYLDGRHDRTELIQMLEALVANGSLVLKKKPNGDERAQDITKIVTETLDRSLARFQQCNLLVG